MAKCRAVHPAMTGEGEEGEGEEEEEEDEEETRKSILAPEDKSG